MQERKSSCAFLPASRIRPPGEVPGCRELCREERRLDSGDRHLDTNAPRKTGTRAQVACVGGCGLIRGFCRPACERQAGAELSKPPADTLTRDRGWGHP